MEIQRPAEVEAWWANSEAAAGVNGASRRERDLGRHCLAEADKALRAALGRSVQELVVTA